MGPYYKKPTWQKKQNSRLANHIFTARLIIIPLASAINIVALAVSEYPVYRSLYDDFDWMERFGDPLFHRHVVCTERAIFSNSESSL